MKECTCHTLQILLKYSKPINVRHRKNVPLHTSVSLIARKGEKKLFFFSSIQFSNRQVVTSLLLPIVMFMCKLNLE